MFPLAEIVAFDVTQSQPSGPTSWTPAAVVWVACSIIGAVAVVLTPAMISLMKSFASLTEARSTTAKHDQLSLQVQTLETKLNSLAVSVTPAQPVQPPPSPAAMLPSLDQAQLAQSQAAAGGKDVAAS